jgi:hypothetical protein
MTEVVTILLAGRPVRVELDDAELAAGLREQTRGYDLPAETSPWLRIEAGRLASPRRELGRLSMRPDGDSAFEFASVRVQGVLRTKPPLEATAEVCDMTSLSQVLYLCLSIVLPGEGALLVHADTVEWRGSAIAFLGESGAGKSTAAAQLIERGGARRITADRTVIDASGGEPVVWSSPKLGRKEDLPGAPCSVPLAGLLFPGRGRGVEISPMSPLAAHRHLLRGAIVPGGKGQPAAAMLAVAEGILETTWAAELRYELRQDYVAALETRISK